MIPVTYGYARVSKTSDANRKLQPKLRILQGYGIRREYGKDRRQAKGLALTAVKAASLIQRVHQGKRHRKESEIQAARMRLVCRGLNPISAAARSSVMCSASKLLRTFSLVCSLAVKVTFSMG